jgi:hypothetical protein
VNAKFLLVPVAATAIASPALAEESEAYLTVEQAQQAIFPGATFRRDFFDLREAEFDRIRDTANVTQWVRYIRAWRVSSGGWFLVDQVVGRDDNLLYGIGINPDGSVKGIEIIQCLPRYSAIRNPPWRRQVAGVRRATYNPTAVRSISGVTLSAEHIADGVKRVLVTYDLLLKNRR